jgi:hypothetical protein
MTVRTAAAIGSLTLAVGSLGCVTFYEIGVETPVQAKINVSAFQRVLVAGFLAGGSKNIDPNTETARLLRSQLRTKSDLRVIDVDALALVEEVDRRRREAGGAAAAGAEDQQGDEPKIKNERDLQEYEPIFADTDFWKKLGEEHQNPLIITGSVLFTEIAKSGMFSRVQPIRDPMTGVVSYTEDRQWSDLKGYALAPKFIFIDGRTGEQLYAESFREESLYPTSQNTPALSSYFELMDKLLPGFLNTLSTQKIKGTRVLLK